MTEPPYLSEYQAGYIHKPSKAIQDYDRRLAQAHAIYDRLNAEEPAHLKPCPVRNCELIAGHNKHHVDKNGLEFVHIEVIQEEQRVVDPETGGMKGQKLARFSSIPSDVLWELAEHFGRGEAKYPNDPETGQPNWQKGYDWRLNVDALQRHLHQWLQGEDTDPETGSNHLVAVIWHAMVLRWFQIHEKGRDFR